MQIKSVLIIIFIFGIFMNEISAQDKAECEKIVAATAEAINGKAPEQLEKFLAPNFTFSGQKAPLAKMVLNQLIKQINDKVENYKKISEKANGEELTLVYEFVYAEKLGTKTSTFIFNKDNQLVSLNLLEIQVKTMPNEQAQVKKSEQAIITIPIEIRDKIITTKATVNGESKTFIIDNGSPRLVLNSKYFGTLAKGSSSISTVKGVNTSVSNMDIIKISDFDFQGIKINENSVLTMDIAHLEQELGTEIYGLIGYEIYKDYDMLFDYANNTLTLIQPTATKNYLEVHCKGSKTAEISLEMSEHIPTVKGAIGKKDLVFGIDCGAGSNLIDEKFYASIEKQVSNVENTDLSGAGETQNVKAGNIESIIIGKKEFRNTRSMFRDMSHINSAHKAQLDGLIGYEILSKQKVLLSFQNGRLIFID